MSRRKIKKAWKKASEHRPVSQKEAEMIHRYMYNSLMLASFNNANRIRTNKYHIKIVFPPGINPIEIDNEIINTPTENKDLFENFKKALIEIVATEFRVPLELLKGEYDGK